LQVQSSLDVAYSAATSTRSAAEKVVGAERVKSVDNLTGSARNAFGNALIAAKETMINVRDDGIVNSAKKATTAIWEAASAVPGQIYTTCTTTVQQTTAKVQERLHAVFQTEKGVLTHLPAATAP
jgi:hypothetical protein